MGDRGRWRRQVTRLDEHGIAEVHKDATSALTLPPAPDLAVRARLVVSVRSQFWRKMHESANCRQNSTVDPHDRIPQSTLLLVLLNRFVGERGAVVQVPIADEELVRVMYPLPRKKLAEARVTRFHLRCPGIAMVG